MSRVKTYLFTYQHEGASWMLELKADSADDARRRLQRLQYADYKGELVAKVPANTAFRAPLSAFLSFLCWLVPRRTK